jgi:hypothetical protein
VPIVLPYVRVEVGSHGTLAVTVDREPYDMPREWARLGRRALPQILDAITSHRASPVRVEVTDGGSTFTDIVTASRRPTANPTPPPRPSVAAPYAFIGEVIGSGFAPEEQVAVAVVVAHQAADDHGVAHLRLPPAVLATRPGLVVLLGTTSGTLALSGGRP